MPSKSWGNTVGSGSGATLTLEWDGVTNDAVNGGIVNPRIKWSQKSEWTDSNNYVDSGGSGINGARVHSGTLNSNRTWNCSPKSVALAYGSTTRVTFSATVYGVSFFNGDSSTSTYSVDIDLPARPYDWPLAPLNFTGSRVNDNRIDLSWQANYTGSNGARPWSGLRLDRWDNVTGTWTRIANLGWSATSYSDTTTQPNRRYKYALWSYNPTGDSPHAHTGDLYTSPAAPTIGTPEKLANGSINVPWVNNSGIAAALEVQDSPDGTTWTSLTSTAPITSPYNHASPNTAVTHRYRMRVKGPTGLWSGWSSTSSVVQLQAPPNAPTNLAPAITAIGEDLVVTWRHNPVDSTQQRAYQLRHRVKGSPTWTTIPQTLSAVSSHTISAATYPNPTDVEVEVSTWGAHADPSPWSATLTTKRANRPTAGISTPPSGTVLTGTDLVVNLTYFQPQGTPLAAWSATLKRAGATVATRNGGPADPPTGVRFDDALEDSAAYTLEVQVTSTDGLSSTITSAAYTVDYAEPPTPTIVVAWDPDTASATVTITNPAGTPEVVLNRIYGNGQLLGEVPPNGALTWRVPPLTGATMMVRAVTDLPSSADSLTVPVPIPPYADKGIHLNAGPGYALHAAVWGGTPTIGTTPTLDVDLQTWEGDQLPSPTFGYEEGQELTIACRVLFDMPGSSRAHWERVLRARTTICYRDAARTLYGVVTAFAFSDERYIGRANLQLTFVETLHDDRDLFDYQPTLIEDPPGSGQYRVVQVALDNTVYGLLP